MIDPKSRSREWILESCEKNKVKDPTLMEKTISYCLQKMPLSINFRIFVSMRV